VDIYVEGQRGSQPILIQKTGTNQPASTRPDLLLPLQSAQTMLGEVRLWRKDPSPGPSDEHLLAAFSSQGVLALERARLSQAETRAQVLEESDRLKSSLLSSVSHELRTPLATIKAAVTGLHSGEVEWDSDARADLLAVIEEEADHLDRLVSNLLNMSRIEAGALQPQRSWHSVEEIVDGVERMRNRFQETSNHTNLISRSPKIFLGACRLRLMNRS
jgi:two-component system sensor histidine kinase KdpD